MIPRRVKSVNWFLEALLEQDQMAPSLRLQPGLIRRNLQVWVRKLCYNYIWDLGLIGMTSQTEAVAPPGWWVNLATGKFLFFSPNLVWLIIALTDYFLFPYDYEAAKDLSDLSWIKTRFLVNFTITFGFFGFWHVVLYILGWSERPFHQSRTYRMSKVAHNMWYCFLGKLWYSNSKYQPTRICTCISETILKGLFSLLFGRHSMSTAVLQTGFHSCLMKKLLQVPRTSSCSYCHSFGFHSTENFTSTLPTGDRFVWRI